MVKNQFQIIYKTLTNNKVISVINLSGLVIGISSFILIILYVQQELTFDRFNENYNQIFKVSVAGGFNYIAPYAVIINDKVPEIEKIVRNMNSSKEVMIYAIVNWLKNGISNSEKEFTNSEIYLSDSYKIKSLMKELDLTNNLSYNQLKSVYNIYKENSLDLSSLEITPILKDFLTNKYLFCIVCENEFKSYIDVIKEKNCKGKCFHPKFSKTNSNIHSFNNEKYECLHNNCNNKIRQDTFSCCHKIITHENNKKGCIQGFGKHQLIIKDKKS